METTIIATIIYILVLGILAYSGYKKTKSESDFLLAGRKMHPIVMALSYGATFISTSAIVGFGGAAGQYGMSLLWLTFLTIFVGVFIAFVGFGKRTRRLGQELGAHTLPELLSLRFDSKFIQGFIALLIFLFMPIYASAILKGSADFIAKYYGISFITALGILIVLISVYVTFGGLKGIMYADAFQGGIMFLGMLFILVFTYSALGGLSQAHIQLTNLFAAPGVGEQSAKLTAIGFKGWTSMPEFDSPLWWSVISTLVMGVGIGVLAQPQLAVKFMTVKSDRELNRAVLSGGIFLFMMTGTAFIVGALTNVFFYNDTGNIAITAAGANDLIIPAYIKEYLPRFFGDMFIIILLAASLSTLSALFHTMGTAFGRDFIEKSVGVKGKTIRAAKIGMIISIVLSAVLTYLSSKLDVSMAIIAQGTSLFFGLCAAAFLPSYFGALYLKKFPKAGALASILTGTAISLFWIFFINQKQASSLQLCNIIFGKPSIVSNTPLSKLAMVDSILVALPASILAGAIAWIIYHMIHTNSEKTAEDKAA